MWCFNDIKVVDVKKAVNIIIWIRKNFLYVVTKAQNLKIHDLSTQKNPIYTLHSCMYEYFSCILQNFTWYETFLLQSELPPFGTCSISSQNPDDGIWWKAGVVLDKLLQLKDDFYLKWLPWTDSAHMSGTTHAHPGAALAIPFLILRSKERS